MSVTPTLPADIQAAVVRAIEDFERCPKGTLGRRDAKHRLAMIIDGAAKQGGAKSLAIDLLEQEVSRLEIRVQDLLVTNTAYLNRAREAEAKLRELQCPSSSP
jgi:hypothetical protein